MPTIPSYRNQPNKTNPYPSNGSNSQAQNGAASTSSGFNTNYPSASNIQPSSTGAQQNLNTSYTVSQSSGFPNQSQVLGISSTQPYQQSSSHPMAIQKYFNGQSCNSGMQNTATTNTSRLSNSISQQPPSVQPSGVGFVHKYSNLQTYYENIAQLNQALDLGPSQASNLSSNPHQSSTVSAYNYSQKPFASNYSQGTSPLNYSVGTQSTTTYSSLSSASTCYPGPSTSTLSNASTNLHQNLQCHSNSSYNCSPAASASNYSPCPTTYTKDDSAVNHDSNTSSEAAIHSEIIDEICDIVFDLEDSDSGCDKSDSDDAQANKSSKGCESKQNDVTDVKDQTPVDVADLFGFDFEK